MEGGSQKEAAVMGWRGQRKASAEEGRKRSKQKNHQKGTGNHKQTGIGNSKLNSTLFIIGKHLSGRCSHCGERVEHILITCRNYEEERRMMTATEDRTGGDKVHNGVWRFS